MVLLTSGQVSVAISSVVIFLFTFALFLSGYVLQQQTVRDIRRAIKPPDVPTAARMYLPAQFQDQPAPAPTLVNRLDDQTESVAGKVSGKGDTPVVIEIPGYDSGRGEAVEENITTDSGFRFDTPISETNQVSVDEDNRADDLLLTPSDPKMEPAPSPGKGDKPLSAAERRKLIKQQVLAAGEGEGFKGYRRRMW